MNKHKKRYYFYIEPYMHVSNKRNTSLMYNPLNNKYLIYRNDLEIMKLLQRISSQDNMGVIKLTDSKIKNNHLSKFINHIRDNFMGDIIDTDISNGKPVQMRHSPIVKKDIQYLTKEKGFPAGEDILKYLSELSLYINSACDAQCSDCNKYYKQYLCCTRPARKNRELPIENIRALFKQVKASGLSRVNILGGNVLKYSQLKPLIRLLKKSPFQTIFHFNYTHLSKAGDQLAFMDFENARYEIMVTPPYSKKDLDIAIQKTKPLLHKVRYLYVVQSNGDVRQAKDLVMGSGLPFHGFKPFANGKNLNFFRENVYLNRRDIFKARPSRKEIYANGLLNRLNFGRITVLISGAVHANVNTPRLGILCKDSIYKILAKEMNNGKNWWRIRSKLDPCRNCVMSELCPPPGSYEYSLKHNNLCHVWETIQ